jgi:hypothetical protein
VNFTLSPSSQVLGMLPLTELRLDSWAFKQQPTLSRPAFSHVTNDGVKALVDAICARMLNSRGESLRCCLSWLQDAVAFGGPTRTPTNRNRPTNSTTHPPPPPAEATPLKLSLAGATTINHEAVSALLRLPALTELDIAGCTKITPMDKMRLVAKVKAGREFLRSRG